MWIRHAFWNLPCLHVFIPKFLPEIWFIVSRRFSGRNSLFFLPSWEALVFFIKETNYFTSSDPHPGISSHYSDIYFGILLNILSDIYSDILSGSLSGIYSGSLSGIYSGSPSGR